jgi:uncharacterized RDD family membrane protein YckC
MEEHNNITLERASRKRRIAAYFIDHFVFTFLIVAIAFLAMGPNAFDSGDVSSMPFILISVLIPGFLLYFAKDFINGISPGRWVAGIMVRSSLDWNQVPSRSQLFVRNLFMIIYPVEAIVMISNPDKLRLGDKSQKTVVLRNPNESDLWKRLCAVAAIGILFFSFIFLFVGNALKSSEAYKIAVSEIESDSEIIERTGGIVGYGLMPAGQMSTNSTGGSASLVITVKGEKEDVKVEAILEKDFKGEWTLIELNK